MLKRTLISYLLVIFDLCFTRYWVYKYSIEIEGNPFGKWILAEPWRQAVFKIALPAAILALIYFYRQYKIAVRGSYAILITHAMLAVYHIVILVLTKFTTQ